MFSWRCGSLLVHMSHLWTEEINVAWKMSHANVNAGHDGITLHLRAGGSTIKLGGEFPIPAIGTFKDGHVSGLAETLLAQSSIMLRNCSLALTVISDSLRAIAELAHRCPDLEINYCCGAPRHVDKAIEDSRGSPGNPSSPPVAGKDLKSRLEGFPLTEAISLYQVSQSHTIFRTKGYFALLGATWGGWRDMPTRSRVDGPSTVQMVSISEGNVNASLSRLARALECGNA